jgi:hypothetical protein
MRIGIIADGQAEYRSLPKLVERIESQNKVVKTLYADIQPLAPISQIVAAIKSKLPILKSKSVDMALILIDRENRNVCPGDWAQEIEQALEKTCGQAGITSFAVVVKDSCYENWLVSDIQVFDKMPKRFSISSSNIKRIEPNKADRADAQSILEKSAKGEDYDKVQDSVRIMNLADPIRIASNSRSFRRFLRLIGHASYKDQSCQPCQ